MLKRLALADTVNIIVNMATPTLVVSNSLLTSLIYTSNSVDSYGFHVTQFLDEPC